LVSGGFCNPQPGDGGELPPTRLTACIINWDLGIMKNIPITEAKNLEFRVEMFNAPNHPTFAVGNSN